MFDENETLERALARNVRDALAEDIGRGDWTAMLVPAGRRATGRVVAKEAAVLCGQPWFEACVHALDASARLTWHAAEGAAVTAGTEVCRIEADARALLSAERSALNFLQMLSAVASSTRQYVEAIAGLSPNPRGCAVLDTRKTQPGLRQAQKYAVRVGGGQNQRTASSSRRTTSPRPVASRRRCTRPSRWTAACRCRSRWKAWPSCAKPSPAGRRACCSTTSRSPTCTRPTR
jgi:nicotinate-nucleotide pyrophosphorylase (carboxylating)